MYTVGLFLSEAYNASVKKFQKNYSSWHWRMMQNLKKNLTCDLKHNWKNLVNVHASSGKSGNFYLEWLLFSKVSKNLDEKVKKCYVSWHWSLMQGLKKNWLFVQKVIWGICWILSPKICTLMCYFSAKKKYGRVISHSTKKNEEKLTFCLKSDMRNLVNYNLAVESLKICFLLSCFCTNYVILKLKITKVLCREKLLLILKIT